MKTLILNFVAASPAPAGGYLVKYREVGTLTYNTVTSASIPIQISVPDGKNWEGTIQSICSPTSKSPEKAWNINDTPPPPLGYALNINKDIGGDMVTVLVHDRDTNISMTYVSNSNEINKNKEFVNGIIDGHSYDIYVDVYPYLRPNTPISLINGSGVSIQNCAACTHLEYLNYSGSDGMLTVEVGT